jgi:hypothetical protein
MRNRSIATIIALFLSPAFSSADEVGRYQISSSEAAVLICDTTNGRIASYEDSPQDYIEPPKDARPGPAGTYQAIASIEGLSRNRTRVYSLLDTRTGKAWNLEWRDYGRTYGWKKLPAPRMSNKARKLRPPQ